MSSQDEPVHAGPCPECGQMVQHIDDGDGGVEYRELRLPVKDAAHLLLGACKAVTKAIDPESGYADHGAAVRAARRAEDAIKKAEGPEEGEESQLGDETDPEGAPLIDLSFEDRNDLLDALSEAYDDLTPDQYAALDDLFHEWKNSRPEEARALQRALGVIVGFEVDSGSQNQE